MTLDRSSGARLPAVMGALMSGYPLGIGIGLVTLPGLGLWRTAMGIATVFCAVALAVGFLVLGDTKTAEGPAQTHRASLEAGILAPLIAIGLVWCLLSLLQNLRSDRFSHHLGAVITQAQAGVC